MGLGLGTGQGLGHRMDPTWAWEELFGGGAEGGGEDAEDGDILGEEEKEAGVEKGGLGRVADAEGEGTLAPNKVAEGLGAHPFASIPGPGQEKGEGRAYDGEGEEGDEEGGGTLPKARHEQRPLAHGQLRPGTSRLCCSLLDTRNRNFLREDRAQRGGEGGLGLCVDGDELDGEDGEENDEGGEGDDDGEAGAHAVHHRPAPLRAEPQLQVQGTPPLSRPEVSVSVERECSLGE